MRQSFGHFEIGFEIFGSCLSYDCWGFGYANPKFTIFFPSPRTYFRFTDGTAMILQLTDAAAGTPTIPVETLLGTFVRKLY